MRFDSRSVRPFTWAPLLAVAIASWTVSCAAPPDPGRQVLLDATRAIGELQAGAYEYEYHGTGSLSGSYRGTVAFSKPVDGGFFFKAVITPSPTPPLPGQEATGDRVPELIIASNGRELTARDEAIGRFSYGTYAGGSGHLAGGSAYAVLFQLSQDDPFSTELAGEITYVGRETVGGVECDVVTAANATYGGAEVSWYIAVEDRLPRAQKWVVTQEGVTGEFFFEMSDFTSALPSRPDALASNSEPDDEIVYEDARLVGVDAIAPGWTLATPDGETVVLADLRGDVVVLDVWASWCVPCWTLMPEFDRIARTFEGERVRFFAVNAWESPEVSPPEYMSDRGLEYAVLLRGETLAPDYKIAALPALFVIGPDGTLAYLQNPVVQDPATIGAELEEAIRSVLP